MRPDRRKGGGNRRRDPTRSGGGPARRGRCGCVIGNRRARFSIFYFILALLLVLGLNYLAGQQGTTQIPYSDLKARIAAGEVSEVTIGPELIRARAAPGVTEGDRKSTRLNSSHVAISYAVFCLKKKNTVVDVISSEKELKALPLTTP